MREASSSEDHNKNNQVIPAKLFHNFDTEIKKQQKHLNRYSSDNFFCNFNKEALFDKINKKNEKMNERLKRFELARRNNIFSSDITKSNLTNTNNANNKCNNNNVTNINISNNDRIDNMNSTCKDSNSSKVNVPVITNKLKTSGMDFLFKIFILLFNFN